MRLIDADEIGLTDFEIVMCEGSYKNALGSLIYKISNAPTIDAVPVIHCNECKHYKQSTTADRKMCFRKDIDGFSVCYEFEPNDWCSYAERKAE